MCDYNNESDNGKKISLIDDDDISFDLLCIDNLYSNNLNKDNYKLIMVDSKDIKKVVETSFSKKETDTSNDTNKIDVPKNNNNNDKIINNIDTINNNNIIINKKPIFEIRKDKKEPKGRRKKGNNLKKTKNDKFRRDNTIQRIKSKFVSRTMIAINRLYDKYSDENGLRHRRFLQKIAPIFSNIKIYQQSLEYMQKKVWEMFSEKLSVKCFRQEKDYNTKSIENLFRENEALEIIKILNFTIKEIYEIYIGISDYIIPGYGLKYDLDKIIEKEGNDYAEKYEEIAKNLIQIYEGKYGRTLK